MAQASWRFKAEISQKLQGSVWLVESPIGRMGYFKFADANQWWYAGPFLANECITVALAHRLDYPVAECRVTDVVGPDNVVRHGLVSIVTVAPEVTTWSQVDAMVRNCPEEHIARLERLQQLVVFDAWIANVDRATGKNIVVYRTRDDDRYQWYLIDHALALLGAPYKWENHLFQETYWIQLWKYYHVPQGLLRIQSSWEVLNPMIDQIEHLTVSDIEEAVCAASDGSMSAELQRQTVELLLYRQRKLRTMIERWLAYGGIKEYGAIQS